MREALYYDKLDGNRVKCRLCPNECLIAPGKRGSCGVRINKDGKLFSEIYGHASSVALDPIEKKPLYRYHPGEKILSIGTSGCNLHCGFCQNWQISQDPAAPTRQMSPEQAVAKARELESFGIAYTYNEPFVWYEFVLDTAILAKKSGLENILVTNGYVNTGPLKRILPYIGAMNIDLKSFDDKFYSGICGGKLDPVLETIKTSAKACHVELTNLIIPTLNDSEEAIRRMVDWIFMELGKEAPLHFSRYFPCYKMNIRPTPIETLKMAEAIAREKLKYVYLGNI